MNLLNIPDKIASRSQCCHHCNKEYKTRKNLEKHLLLCEIFYNSKTTRLLDDDDAPIPSPKKMYQLLVELSQKYNRLEEKVDEINKWVIKKKKKINVLEWLNTNITPETIFENIIDKIIVTDEDIEFLFNNTFMDTLNKIFTRTFNTHFQKEEKEYIPIFAFTQKVNMFYIYNTTNLETKWIELNRENLIRLMNKIHMKISKAFYNWKQVRTTEIKGCDKLSTICNKTQVKIMDIEFKQDAVLGKIKSILYNILKTDMKAILEYEFEF